MLGNDCYWGRPKRSRTSTEDQSLYYPSCVLSVVLALQASESAGPTPPRPSGMRWRRYYSLATLYAKTADVVVVTVLTGVSFTKVSSLCQCEGSSTVLPLSFFLDTNCCFPFALYSSACTYVLLFIRLL